MRAATRCVTGSPRSCSAPCSSGGPVSRRSGRCTTPRTTPVTPSASPVTDGTIMFRRIFAAALGAGIGVGVLIAALQHVALVPMILEAEKYEKGTVAPHHEHGAISTKSGVAVASLLVTEAKAHDHEADAPMVAEDSPWRPVFTWMATTLTSVGFALLLVGAYAVSGRAVDAREGLLWGIAGFAAFALAPAFCLPPELPGSLAADLVARQAWWIGTAVATAAAIG